MTTITFTVPGTPIAKGRPRATTIGGHARMYTPAKTVRYESDVALFAAQAMAGRPPVDGPCIVIVSAVMPVPASWPKSKQRAALAGDLYPTGKPDLDNLLKAIGDGANGVIWTDDSRIVDLHITKRYGLTPGVHVVVTWTHSEAAADSLLEAA